MTAPEVQIKSLPAYRLQSVRGTMPASSSVPGRFDTVMQNLAAHPHPDKFRECVAVYYNMPGRDWDIEIGFTVPEDYDEQYDMPNGEKMAISILPAVPDAACLIHKGEYSKLHEAYGHIMQWMDANGYQPAGPCREVYLNSPDETPPAELLTEIQFPVFKR
jgi:effector-binding domain-containing protein